MNIQSFNGLKFNKLENPIPPRFGSMGLESTLVYFQDCRCFRIRKDFSMSLNYLK
jgi:hypothetical protein